MARPFPPSLLPALPAHGETCPPTPPLGGSRRADVCVVGGGFTGLSAALHLAEAGADVVLVEADEHRRAARPGATAGRSIPASGSDVLWLEKKFGFERARRRCGTWRRRRRRWCAR